MPTIGTTTITKVQASRAKELGTQIRAKNAAMHETKKTAEHEIELLRTELKGIQATCNHGNWTSCHDEMDCEDCGATWRHGRGWYCSG